MKILQVSTHSLPVRGDLQYGGTERIVYLTDKYITKMGHESYVAAPSGSKVEGHLIRTVPKYVGVPGIAPYDALTEKERLSIKINHMLNSFKQAISSRNNFDFIHIHIESMFPFLSLIKKPSLLTLHNSFTVFWEPSPHKDLRKLHGELAAISRSQSEIFKSYNYKVNYVVHNGLEPSKFVFSEQKQDFLLNVGNISSWKQPHIALEAAKRAGQDIIIGGNIPERAYYKKYVKPLITHDISKDISKLDKILSEKSSKPKIIYIGMVDEEIKKHLYSKAKAFIMPVSKNEPFGLVMIESMVSGTPVIALKQGPAPEIVDNKRTGYLVSTVDKMADAVSKITKIKPIVCRKHVLKNFTGEIMAKNYLDVYKHISKHFTMY